MKKWSRHLLAAGALALGMSAAHADDNNTLYFYNWTEYVPPGLLEQFTKETGIKVIYSTYESNETMYAKLKTYKDGAYDLVVPSTYYVDKMRKEGMIQKIDKSKLSNFSNLDPDMLNKPFDPNNDYSIPYIWGATAIGVNGDAVDPKSVTSWADLWKPEYKGSLLLTDDAREVFQMALRKLGYSGNTTDPKEIEAAYNELKKLMPNVAAFNSDNPANPYMEGEVNLGMIWNGSAFVARQAGTPIDVVWPKEGGIFWMDSLAIPANAKNKEGALKLINFLLRPDVAKQVAETIGFPPPNLAARMVIHSPRAAIENGIGVLTENRKEQGLFLELAAQENITMATRERDATFGMLNRKKAQAISADAIALRNIRVPPSQVRAGGLSGGNQQKLLISRWVAIGPRILILDEPTRGVDVGAKSEIYRIMNQMARKGVAILMISSELPEVVGMSDRVYVMREGSIAGELHGRDISHDIIMTLSTGVDDTHHQAV